jgi:hypothetical protein
MSLIERRTKVQPSKAKASCKFLFDACIRLMSFPWVLVIFIKPDPALSIATAVLIDNEIMRMLRRIVNGFRGACDIMYKFEIA